LREPATLPWNLLDSPNLRNLPDPPSLRNWPDSPNLRNLPDPPSLRNWPDSPNLRNLPNLRSSLNSLSLPDSARRVWPGAAQPIRGAVAVCLKPVPPRLGPAGQRPRWAPPASLAPACGRLRSSGCRLHRTPGGNCRSGPARRAASIDRRPRGTARGSSDSAPPAP
jgi:hypothetical protein